MFKRFLGQHPTPIPPVNPTLETVRPGDAIAFWDGADCMVRGVYEAHEELNGRRTAWRWVFCTPDRVVEVAPQRTVCYDMWAVTHQGEQYYDYLVGPGGALKRFEGNVREGIAHLPVEVPIDDVTYKIRATGTFAATLTGLLLDRTEVWPDVAPRAADNVYARLERMDGADPGDVGLIVWTTHIMLLRGRVLDRSAITGIFPGAR
jgi:hypothetical protein